MWSADRLKQVVAARGETMPRDKQVAEMLLAHERSKGRTEEDYPRNKAERELKSLVERFEGELPPAKGKEYPGMKELRAYVEDKQKARENNTNGKAPMMDFAGPDAEPERDR